VTIAVTSLLLLLGVSFYVLEMCYEVGLETSVAF